MSRSRCAWRFEGLLLLGLVIHFTIHSTGSRAICAEPTIFLEGLVRVSSCYRVLHTSSFSCSGIDVWPRLCSFVFTYARPSRQTVSPTASACKVPNCSDSVWAARAMHVNGMWETYGLRAHPSRPDALLIVGPILFPIELLLSALMYLASALYVSLRPPYFSCLEPVLLLFDTAMMHFVCQHQLRYHW